MVYSVVCHLQAGKVREASKELNHVNIRAGNFQADGVKDHDTCQ